MGTNEAYEEIRTYIDTNPIAVLGTTNLDGSPYGAVVYVCADDNKRVVYFLTKSETLKYKNLLARGHVSLTIVNPSENSTLQSDGRAFVVTDHQIGTMVVEKISRLHDSAVDWLPPLVKLRAGQYVVIGVEIWHARLARFKGMVSDVPTVDFSGWPMAVHADLPNDVAYAICEAIENRRKLIGFVDSWISR